MAIGVALIVATQAGCSDGKAHIDGLVTLDGEPLGGEGIRALVVFESVSGGSTASGFVGNDGRYEAVTGSTPGVEPGVYAVSIRGKRMIPSDDPNYPPRSEPMTPPRYASSKTSGLSIDAQPGSNTFDIALSAEP